MVQRRQFSKEFKLEADNLVIARGVSLAQAGRQRSGGCCKEVILQEV